MHCTILLVGLGLFANAGATFTRQASHVTPAIIHPVALSVIATQHNHSTKRLLRTHTLTNDGEERVVSVPGLETVVNSVKSTVSMEKLQEWLKKGESVDDAVKLLTLDQAADDLLANPNLNGLISYIKLFNEQNPTKMTSLVATLTTHYGDEGLAKIIEAAKRVKSTESIANQVQTDQLQHWLTSGKTTDEVFLRLGLDKAADDLLATPQLNTWISYMKLYNQNNPTKKTSLIATFTAHYGDEGLAKIVEGAKLDKRTAFTAKRVQTEQIQRWLVDGKTPDDVFALLKLDEVGVQLFKQPQVNTWVKYMDDFKKANPDVETTLFTDLSGRFTEQTLVHMLIAAKKVPSTESVAVRIQAEQSKYWLSVGKPPADVFTLLRLHYEGVSLFSNPLFTAWIQYTDEFRKIYFGTELTAISALRKHYSPDILSWLR
ncbi:unnamed protein product [Phytophthora fragariaefolia]|uniref:RxLR effector protein n=1 Tax=Phytophthora fragariaefolia TaxID=1490495 RepID=A0A9W7CQF6_9STRA|nr:unnamed protein product [Phytophthora fragariaefolia]